VLQKPRGCGTSVSGLQPPAATSRESQVQPSGCFQDRVLGAALHCHPVSLHVRACASKCQSCLLFNLSNTRRGWANVPRWGERQRRWLASLLSSPPTALTILGPTCCAGHHPSCPFTLSGSSVGQHCLTHPHRGSSARSGDPHWQLAGQGVAAVAAARFALLYPCSPPEL
jgi:hypothetical protein